MNTITDFHTHRLEAANALISVDVRDFAPRPGLFYSVGIHPWKVPESGEEDLKLLAEVACHPQVLAIGETGLDTLRGGIMARQRDFFIRHIEIAEQVCKPLVVHNVRSASQVVALWRATDPHKVGLAIHGFRGKVHVALMLLDEGFYLSFGPRFNKATVAATFADRLLIETDDAPEQITQVAQSVAQARGITAEELLRQAQDNTTRFLRLREF